MRRASLLVFVFVLVWALSSCKSTKNDATVNHEGNIGAPVALTVGSTHVGTVGGDLGDDNSYYSFVAANSSQTIYLSNLTQDLKWELYSDANYTNLIRYCDMYIGNGSEICTASPLTPGATYYLDVYNWSIYTANFDLLVN